MQNIKEAFGSNLRKIRKSKKLTIENFSEILGITPRQLSKIESGETFFTAETLCKISVALDVNLQVLFDFEWYDNLMYYDDGKYIKPHFKAIMKNKLYEIKSLPPLKNFKINKKMPIGELTVFLMEFSKNNNMTIYIDFFVDKIRDKIAKYIPDGTFSFLIMKDEVKDKEIKLKDASYYEIIETFKDFSTDKRKVEYIKTALEALNNKNAREKLKLMIDVMDIST